MSSRCAILVGALYLTEALPHCAATGATVPRPGCAAPTAVPAPDPFATLSAESAPGPQLPAAPVLAIDPVPV